VRELVGVQRAVSDLGEVLFEEVLGSLQAVSEPVMIPGSILEVPGVHDTSVSILSLVEMGLQFAVFSVVGSNGVGMALEDLPGKVRLTDLLLRRRELVPDDAICLAERLARLPERGHRRGEVLPAAMRVPGLFGDAAELFEVLGE
jgi:hypothetical protein